MRTSSRTIVQEAMNGGKECVGKNVRVEKCSTKPCPGNFMRISLKKRSFYHSMLFCKYVIKLNHHFHYSFLKTS